MGVACHRLEGAEVAVDVHTLVMVCRTLRRGRDMYNKTGVHHPCHRSSRSTLGAEFPFLASPQEQGRLLYRCRRSFGWPKQNNMMELSKGPEFEQLFEHLNAVNVLVLSFSHRTLGAGFWWRQGHVIEESSLRASSVHFKSSCCG